MRKRGNRIKHVRRDTVPLAALLPLPVKDRVRVGLEHHTCLHKALTGIASDRDIGLIAEAINMSAALADDGVGPECLELIQRAQQALVRACAHSHKVGRWVIDGEARSLIAQALVLHDEQIALATVLDLRKASAKVRSLAQAGAIIAPPCPSH